MFCSYIKKLQPLFTIDPFLLRLFVKIVALEDLQMLIAKVPTSILLMRLAEEFTRGYQVCKHVGIYVNINNNVDYKKYLLPKQDKNQR